MGWRSTLGVAMALLAGCLEPELDAATEDLPAEPTLTPIDVETIATATPPPSASMDKVRRAPGLYALELAVGGAKATGLVIVPESPPTTLVVVAHGWGRDAEAHKPDLETLAEHGALAVAMDFRGDPGAFKVRTGIDDTNAATLAMQAEYPEIERTLLYGWSLGGEVALLAPITAPPGTYDHVFVGAGVTDLESFWHEAPLARPAIENETGGPPTEVAAEYDARSPHLRAAELAGKGLARVFLVHAAADWPVPVEHAERMYTALQDAGIPVSYYVVTKDNASVCVVVMCQPSTVVAGHDAGNFRLMRPFIEHRIDRLPDRAEAALRGTYDGETGEYEPSDVG
jgi:acetyl esterase/lipase